MDENCIELKQSDHSCSMHFSKSAKQTPIQLKHVENVYLVATTSTINRKQPAIKIISEFEFNKWFRVTF